MLKILASWKKLLPAGTLPGREGLARLQRVLRRRGLYLVLLALLFSGSYYLVTNKAVFHNTGVRTTFQTSGTAAPQAEPRPREPLSGATTVPPDLQGQSGARVAPATTPETAPAGKDAGQPALAAPVNGQIAVRYGFAYAPAFGDYRFHGGVDLAAPANSQVKAASAGEVKQVEYSDAWRYRLTIDNGSGYQVVYANLASIKVAKGDKVQPGTVLGELGEPGTAEAGTQPHLHLELLKNGKTVDPVPAMQ
ncbi:M23 family metallopeptidase [Neomoorella thermoacetica]|uniref:M23 family metallopeptidase n=1 Tax=Neomoorella thermoacetica TaxID=1525 RepID=UPI0008FB1CDE|nr:M23 family metallopeptidase [Moorella thermoacetica]APC09569.1 L-Ala--D-Glu endopeptidase precursor [Moorella thermoacetica]